MNSPREDTYERYRRLMPKSQDLTLLVLKGHLLLEEQLDFFLEEFARNPSLLQTARLTFAQKLRIMQAFTGLSLRAELSKFVEKVNVLRNQLAHSAEVGELDQKVDDLLKTMFQEQFFTPHSKRQRATFLRQAFAYAIAGLQGHARGFTETVKQRLST